MAASSETEVSGLLRSLLPASVACFEKAPSPSCDLDSLCAEERAVAARFGAERAVQYATSRKLAQLAFAELGLARAPLLNHEDRSPIWPNGCIGSVSHTTRLCAVAVARATSARAIGIDVEHDTPLPDALLTRVLTPLELERLRAQAIRARLPVAEMAKVVFSAKESAFKCQFPLTRLFLGFQDAECDLEWETGNFGVRIRASSESLGALAGVPGRQLPRGFRLEGRFTCGEGHVATAVVLP